MQLSHNVPIYGTRDSRSYPYVSRARVYVKYVHLTMSSPGYNRVDGPGGIGTKSNHELRIDLKFCKTVIVSVVTCGWALLHIGESCDV